MQYCIPKRESSAAGAVVYGSADSISFGMGWTRPASQVCLWLFGWVGGSVDFRTAECFRNGHRNSEFSHKKNVIFHSYVTLPEGISGWWFGTWLLSLSIYWECHHPN